MPKLSVLHLSDIHVRNATDPTLSWAQRIAASAFEVVRASDVCLIAVTGDVAFSGSAEQYELFERKLLQPLELALASESGRPVYVAVVPGNHDCVLKPTTTVRTAIINSVKEEPALANDESVVEHCTSVQKDFFAFRDRTCKPKPETSSRLFWQQTFDVSGHRVRLSSLNAAWMSTLPEEQGQLVFPVQRFERRPRCRSTAPSFAHSPPI